MKVLSLTVHLLALHPSEIILGHFLEYNVSCRRQRVRSSQSWLKRKMGMLVYILSWENTEPGVSGDTPSTYEDIFGEMENLSERWLW